mmetsp:Transcript_1232/g.5500  ORF Transcript_1232/g.5500 Transcript_1232/m.5500 type:complete len:228 (+) Transcript_1232:809-1492(+)
MNRFALHMMNRGFFFIPSTGRASLPSSSESESARALRLPPRPPPPPLNFFRSPPPFVAPSPPPFETPSPPAFSFSAWTWTAPFLAASTFASSSSSSESMRPSANCFLLHSSYSVGDESRARSRRSRRTLRMPPVAATSRTSASRSTSSKMARTMPSHVGWLTSESDGALAPSSSSAKSTASSRSSSSSSSSPSSRGLKRSSSRGSLEDAATERLCTRSDASSRAASS